MTTPACYSAEGLFRLLFERHCVGAGDLELFVTTYVDADGDVDSITHWTYEFALEFVRCNEILEFVVNKVVVLSPVHCRTCSECHERSLALPL